MSESSPAPVEIRTDGLLLRPYVDDDAPQLFAAVQESIGSVGRWLPWCRAEYTAADACAWIALCNQEWASGEHFAFAIFDARDGAFVGAVGLNQRNRVHNFMSLGYWTRQSRQGGDITRRAAWRVVEFGFRDVCLTRIEIIIQPENAASRRVAEALGAQFEVIARNRIFGAGTASDGAVYALAP